jgi:hypothetical protein
MLAMLTPYFAFYPPPPGFNTRGTPLVFKLPMFKQVISLPFSHFITAHALQHFRKRHPPQVFTEPHKETAGGMRF